jgi:polyisoprenyl-teichoic acid--peptidoglycan teichoic acid transferase
VFRDLDRRQRHWVARAATSIALFSAIGAGGSAIMVNASDTQSASVNVDTDVGAVLTKESQVDIDTGEPVETFLLVGSDTRSGADPNSPDFGGIGGYEDNEVRHSDTIMILRHELSTGRASLLSIPRDLYVEIAGTNKKGRINTAYDKGTDVLVETIENNFNIPINHYVEVDFNGFKSLVDAVGGVEACFWYPTRDTHTGLNAPRSGCYNLDGTQALQYTRSRYFEEFRDGEWSTDERYDLGRIARQQQFILQAVSRSEEALGENPFLVKTLVDTASMAIRVDKDLELLALAARFRDLEPANLLTYTVPSTPKRVGDADVLIVDKKKADPIFAFFSGKGPAPDPAPTEYDQKEKQATQDTSAPDSTED